MDKIMIDGLEIFANHGVFPEENKLGQKFVISAVLWTDTRPAGCSDDLNQSINYGEVSQRITEFVQKKYISTDRDCGGAAGGGIVVDLFGAYKNTVEN